MTWKIGKKYKIKSDGGVGKHEDKIVVATYRLIDVTERGLFVFKPTKPGKCVTYKAWELDQKVKNNEVEVA